MSFRELGAVLLLALAAELAHLLAAPEHQPHHRPVARALLALLALDLFRELLRHLVLLPARVAAGVHPYEGGARFAFHVDQAALLAFPFLQLALYARVLGRSRWLPYMMLYFWARLTLDTALQYPVLRGAALLAHYATVQRIAGGGAAFAIAFFVAAVAAGKDWPSSAQRCALLLAASDLLALGGPYLIPARLVPDWWLAHVLNLICYGLLVLEQGRTLWRSTRARMQAGSSSSSD